MTVDPGDPIYEVCVVCHQRIADPLGAHQSSGWADSLGPCTFRFHPWCCPGNDSGIDCDTPDEPHDEP